MTHEELLLRCILGEFAESLTNNEDENWSNEDMMAWVDKSQRRDTPIIKPITENELTPRLRSLPKVLQTQILEVLNNARRLAVELKRPTKN